MPFFNCNATLGCKWDEFLLRTTFLFLSSISEIQFTQPWTRVRPAFYQTQLWWSVRHTRKIKGCHRDAANKLYQKQQYIHLGTSLLCWPNLQQTRVVQRWRNISLESKWQSKKHNSVQVLINVKLFAKIVEFLSCKVTTSPWLSWR